MLYWNTTSQFKFWFLVKEEIQSTLGTGNNLLKQNRTQATLMEGESSYQCSSAAPFFFINFPLLPTLNRSNALQISLSLYIYQINDDSVNIKTSDDPRCCEKTAMNKKSGRNGNPRAHCARVCSIQVSHCDCKKLVGLLDFD